MIFFFEKNIKVFRKPINPCTKKSFGPTFLGESSFFPFYIDFIYNIYFYTIYYCNYKLLLLLKFYVLFILSTGDNYYYLILSYSYLFFYYF